MKKTEMSAAMWKGLEDFADAGGHGYGEHAYLSKSTARALSRRGLVTLCSRDLGNGRRMAWGFATAAGRAMLCHRNDLRRAVQGAGFLVPECDELSRNAHCSPFGPGAAA